MERGIQDSHKAIHRHANDLAALLRAVLESPAVTDLATRAAAYRADALPPPLGQYAARVADESGGIGDAEIEALLAGGCAPDVISSDIHVYSANSPGMPYLPNVMSKFMALGFTLEQVVAMATSTPAKIINRLPKLGTLQIGAPADVAVMELVEGPVSFVDTRNNKRDGKTLLKPVQTVINGVPFGRPYQAPFAVR